MNRVSPPLSHYNYLELKALAAAIDAALQDVNVKGKRVLDVGCGDKPYAAFFREAKEYVGLDSNGRADVNGNAEALPYSDAEFDVVFSTQVLQYLSSPQKAVDEMHRVLKKGGYAVVSAPAVYPKVDPPNPKWRFMPAGLQQLFSRFTAVDVRPVGGTHRCLMQCDIFYVKETAFKPGPLAWFRKRLFWWFLFPVYNLTAEWLDNRHKNPLATLDYVVVAQK